MRILKNVRLNGKPTDIGVENGKIAAIGASLGEGRDFGGLNIYPGLIDIHSHGCIGYDTMDEENHLGEMAEYLLSEGTTTWYPTTMTMSREDIVRATSRPTFYEGGANIPGFHMEGPFINEKYKGAQNRDYISCPDMSLLDECGPIKMVTLAPELDGSMEFISKCPAVVSLGHTDTDYATAREAFERGARCLTHTYNAMPGIHHRAPGPIGAASDTDGVYAQLITDGVHIHPSSVRMLVSIMGEDRVIIISDGIRATGLADGEYSFGGQPISVKGGVALTEDGKLAGSTSTLFACVKKMVEFGYPVGRAVKMASENPARLMGLNKGKIEVGYDADFILTDDSFNLKYSIARGEF